MRKPADYSGPQQIVRCPPCARCGVPYRPGDKVTLNAVAFVEFAGRTVTVRSLTCSITERGQRRAQWRIHTACGKQFDPKAVAGHAACVEAARRAERRAAA